MDNLSRFCVCAILLCLVACAANQKVDSENSTRMDGRKIMAQTKDRPTKLQVFKDYCDLIGFDPANASHTGCVLQLDIASSTNQARSFSNRHDRTFKYQNRLSPTERIKAFKQRCEEIGFAPGTEPYAECLLGLEITFHKVQAIVDNNQAIDRRISDSVFAHGH